MHKRMKFYPLFYPICPKFSTLKRKIFPKITGTEKIILSLLLTVSSILVPLSATSSLLPKQILAQGQRNWEREAEREAQKMYQYATFYEDRGYFQEALRIYQEILKIFQTTDNLSGQAQSLDRIGLVYAQMGEYSEALKTFETEIAIQKNLGNRSGEATLLNNIGAVYLSIGEYSRALDYAQKSVKIHQETGDRVSEGVSLSTIGEIYYTLGEDREALNYLNRALEAVGSARLYQPIIYTQIGKIYQRRGDYSQALTSFQKGLEIARFIQIPAREAIAQIHIGNVYKQQAQYAQAQQFLEQALGITQKVGMRSEEADTLNELGDVYRLLGRDSEAQEYLTQALTIRKEVGNKGGEAETLSHLAAVFESQNQPELAIAFYKQSVNVTQGLRENLRPLSSELQQSYTETVADRYRNLANVLLAQNRPAEAQQVLDLLKVGELNDYLNSREPGETAAPQNTPPTSGAVAQLPAEEQFSEKYVAFQNEAVTLGKELTQLRQIPEDGRSPEQNQRIAELVQFQQQLSAKFNQFISRPDIKELVQQLNRTSGQENLNLAYLNSLRDNLRRLGQGAVLVYPLVLEDRLEIVLVSADAPPINKSVPVSRLQLETAIADFRTAITDPRKRHNRAALETPARQLYDWLIKPIENELTQADAETIIYAPDGRLRYIPLASLYDGERWLIERYRIDRITAASLTDFNTQPPTQKRVLAAAFTQGTYEVVVGPAQFTFAGLEFAGKEVDRLADTIPNTTTVLNREFTPQATVARMNDYNIVHLATHAALVSGQPEDSFILFGDGSHVSLRDIATWSLPNVDLVVLSACQTGLGGKLGNGEEILGLGYQIQKTGAKAAIASLWAVDDGGTQVLMDAFYQHYSSGNLTKAEALRQAQIALITGNLPASSAPNAETADIRHFAHPYYWAPFILIGNGL